MSAKKLEKLEYITGQEKKLLERFEDFSNDDLCLLRHYENRRRKMYEKLQVVLDKYTDKSQVK